VIAGQIDRDIEREARRYAAGELVKYVLVFAAGFGFAVLMGCIG